MVMLPKPYKVTWDNHDGIKGKSYIMIGFQIDPDNSLHPVLVDWEDGRLLVTGLYDVQVDIASLGLPLDQIQIKRQIPVPKPPVTEA